MANTVASTSTGATLFNQTLPAEAEDLTVEVPRGLKFALDAKLMGQVPKDTEDVNKNLRIYNVLVEPSVRLPTAKELFHPVLRTEDTAAVGHPDVKFNNEYMDAVIDEKHDRADFRSQRLKHFRNHKYVPALVTPRLVPPWRAEGAAEIAVKVTSPAGDARRKIEEAWTHLTELTGRDQFTKRAFNEPTLANSLKRVEKVEDRCPSAEETASWVCARVCDADWKRHVGRVTPSKTPTLHELLVMEADGDAEGSRNMPAPTGKIDECKTLSAPPGSVSKPKWKIQCTTQASRQAASSIHEIREKSRDQLRDLREEYQSKRTMFQGEKNAKDKMSSFEKKMAKLRDAPPVVEEVVVKEEEPKPMAEFLGIFSRGIAMVKENVEVSPAEEEKNKPVSGKGKKKKSVIGQSKKSILVPK